MVEVLAKDYDVLVRPVITEKATVQSANNQVSFIVRSDSTKVEIKQAVQNVFGVKVKAVNTIISKGKVKRFRGKVGKRSDFKKAIITLNEGETIDLSAGAK
jgi:large subunit ribosomal protein L23